jgi:hypothetical protein
MKGNQSTKTLAHARHDRPIEEMASRLRIQSV